MPSMPEETAPTFLPKIFSDWLAARAWSLRPHQSACLEAARRGASCLLIAPTGGGKTLAGFLPSLIELHERGAGRGGGLHTLYVSPLKALAVDIARNIGTPIREMSLDIAVETRTGDTPSARRQRQRFAPPDMLLTTPEQLALLISTPQSGKLFSTLKVLILDELHAMIGSKRGDLLALGLSRLKRLSPLLRTTGLSATVPDPAPLLRFLSSGASAPAELIGAATGAKPIVRVHQSAGRIPWSGHSARHALGEVYDAIRQVRLALVFVNTRSQAEMTFQALWSMNDGGLPIALHHGSLDVERRRKVEAAMSRGALRAVVCTSTLDLGIDWGDVDLVIQMGAPKGASRLTQRIGRANHRMDEPSSALLVPGNRFEVLECLAARDALEEGALDGELEREGALDVLAQHVLGMACAAPFEPDDLYREIISAAPYRGLARADFDKALEFAACGGYALRAYDRFRRIVKGPDGLYRVRNAATAHQYRMNVGTIVEAPAVNIRLAGGTVRRPGRKLGTLEEWFVDGLAPGDTFLFAGEILRFEAMAGTDALVTRAPTEQPRIPTWNGAKFPLTTYLADRVRRMIADRRRWESMPDSLREWLELQQEVSSIPAADELLVETFPHCGRFFLVCYPFDGRLAHQTLGMLLTRRLERQGLQPLGFTPTEYSLSVWGRRDLGGVDLDALFDEDMLGDDLESWLQESVLMKRTFRDCAVIAGLIDRRYPGQEKSGRQVSFSADLIYDVLREHESDHLLLKAAWRDAAGGFLDLARLSGLLARVKGRIRHGALDRVTPLAVPVMLEINKTTIVGEAHEALLKEAANAVIDAGMRR